MRDRIGSIRLPTGRRIRGDGGRGEPIAWATAEPVVDAGRVWAALSEAHAQSGLVPLLLGDSDGYSKRPWDEDEFCAPDDMAGLDDLDVAELMREDWLSKTIEYWEDGRENEDENDVKWVEEEIAPFSRRLFPGLAQAEGHQLSAGQFDGCWAGWAESS